MKYPLAMLNKLLSVYGKDLAVAYDIACAFMKTVSHTSLGPNAMKLNVRGIVPAFHGHAHNRACQLDWHPLYIEGTGIEDFEECERVFSKSNDLAAGTRLSTPFHRHQQIEQHFYFHDEDKLVNSGIFFFNSTRECIYDRSTGRFIYENYRQALSRIKNDEPKLETLSRVLGTGPADYEQFLICERQHLQNLKTEPSEVIKMVEYMECLERLRIAR